MANKSKRKLAKEKEELAESSSPAEEKLAANDPWISKSTGLRTMTFVSLALALFMAWQLEPTEGLFRAILWGLGFGGAIWLVFLGSLTFNRWVRRR